MSNDIATPPAPTPSPTPSPAPAPAPAPSPSPAPAPSLGDWRKSDGSINHAAFEALPEDIRYLKDTLGKYKTDTELLRGFANVSTLAGKKGLIPLPENAPPEAKADRKAILDGINGVPKEWKDYGLKRPDNVPEAAWNQPLADNFQQWAWENSVSPAAMKKLSEVQTKAIGENMATQQQYEKDFWAGQAKEFETAARTQGVQLDKANELAERGATALGFDMANEQEKLVLQNAKVRMAMMRHAIATGEDSFVNGQARASDGGNTQSLMESAMHNQADPLYKPLYDSSHPQHKMAKEKVDGWIRQIAEKQNKR